jgi:hypothetical protein
MKLSILVLTTLSTLAATLPAATIISTPAQAGCYLTVASIDCPPVIIPDNPNTPHSSDNPPWPVITCMAVGDGAVDLVFRNTGDYLIKEGAHVTWRVALTGEVGDFYMPRDLLPGADLTEADLLDIAVPPRTHCLSRLA